MLNKLFDRLENQNLPIQERLFRVVYIVGIAICTIATIVNLFFAKNGKQVVIPIVLIGLTLTLCALLLFKRHKQKLATHILALITILVLLPMMVYFDGGTDNGTPIWMVLITVFVCMLFSGRELAFYLILNLVVDTALFAACYHFPEVFLNDNSRAENHMSSYFSMILVGFGIGLISLYQQHAYVEERRRAEEQAKELESVAKSKDAFFANMSHEIRTPINTIIGLNEMILREENISNEVAENAENIQSASKMLLSVINDILDFSKIESDNMEIVPIQYDMKELINDMVNMIFVRANNKGLEFRVEASESLPKSLYGDVVRIKQVVTNLLTNAVKYSNSGTVVMQVTTTNIGKDKVRLKIAVIDTGIGIKKENIPGLFDYFKRTDLEHNAGIEGSGLGLNISMELMRLMGGDITVDSIYRKGSTFTMTLDQEVVDASPMGPLQASRNENDRPVYEQSFEAPEAKILVVDDNSMNRMVVSKLLRSTKVQIEAADSGASCLELCKEKSFDIILMDHMMPEMDGVETLKNLREDKRGLNYHTPVIALTANVSSDSAKIYSEYGFEDYLAKPINAALLEATLLRHLSPELIENTHVNEKNQEENSVSFVSVTRHVRKKSLVIATDGSIDIPEHIIRDLDIHRMYNYIETKSGRFRDTGEINSTNILHYMKELENGASPVEASVKEYEEFFANELIYAENVIFITGYRKCSEVYRIACEAAGGFSHITIIDSQQYSAGAGLLVRKIAQMQFEGYSIDEITKVAENYSKRIQWSMVVRNLDVVKRNHMLNSFWAKTAYSVNASITLGVRAPGLSIIGVGQHNFKTSVQHYLRRLFVTTNNIDPGIAVIVHVGLRLDELDYIRRELDAKMQFEQVEVLNASPVLSCICGNGAYGVIFVSKK